MNTSNTKHENKLDYYQNNSFILVGISSLIISIVFSIFLYSQVMPFPKITAALVIATCLITSVLSFLSIKKYKKLKYFLCIFLSLTICIMNSSRYIYFGIMLISPILLSLYLLSIKSTIIVSVLQITGVFISKYFRAGNPPEPLPMLNALIAEYSVFLIELIFISAISINLFKFLRIIFEEKRKASKEMLQFSLSAMEYHSKYLKIHNDGLRQIVKIILQDLAKDKKYKLNLEKCKNILFAVQVHDIGKLCVDPLILDKPGKLSSEEFELIKQHPVKGLELFRKIPSGIVEESCKAVCEIIIVEHHERLNGKGYPSGKTDISIEGQIIAVADVVDALLSWRPYKNPFDFEHMRNIITGDDGLNQDICNIITERKEEILKIYETSNNKLQTMFSLTDEEVQAV